MFRPGYRERPWMVRKLRSVWNPARIVSLWPYLERSEAVGARRCGLSPCQLCVLQCRENAGLSTHPYLPASLKVSAGRPRPTAVISARFCTAFFILLPHRSIAGAHLSLMPSAWGITFAAFRLGNSVW